MEKTQVITLSNKIKTLTREHCYACTRQTELRRKLYIELPNKKTPRVETFNDLWSQAYHLASSLETTHKFRKSEDEFTYYDAPQFAGCDQETKDQLEDLRKQMEKICKTLADKKYKLQEEDFKKEYSEAKTELEAVEQKIKEAARDLDASKQALLDILPAQVQEIAENLKVDPLDFYISENDELVYEANLSKKVKADTGYEAASADVIAIKDFLDVEEVSEQHAKEVEEKLSYLSPFFDFNVEFYNNDDAEVVGGYGYDRDDNLWYNGEVTVKVNTDIFVNVDLSNF